MMKRRSKSAISRVRRDGCSKDERYRADNLRARARAPRRSFRGNLSSPLSSDCFTTLYNAKHVDSLDVKNERRKQTIVYKLKIRSY